MGDMSRAESAAATRRALLDDAAELLDSGGPDAVTLREVGARAGVSRGAPYRHFADKESLLTAVAAESWERIGDQMHSLQTDPRLLPADKLRAALIVLITVSRRQPYLYQLMFSTPAGDPAAVVRAAQRSCDEFVAIVASVFGEQNAQRYSAILLTGAHGAAGLELSGLLSTDKWHTTADELIDTLLAMAAEADGRD
jgi:AcrR family transcriptional regulator